MSTVLAFNSHSQRVDRLLDKLRTHLGSSILEALKDPATTDILVNPDGKLFIERAGHNMTDSGTVLDRYQAENVITTLAELSGLVANTSNPLLQCELHIASGRFQGWLPPVSSGPAFAIRKHTNSFRSLQEYLRDGQMTVWHQELIKKAIKSRKNFIICGGTGSGKTTLANAIIREMTEMCEEGERFILLEDTFELRSAAPNTLHLHTTDHIDLSALTRSAMRARPDRIIVGEIRGAEAHALLKVWNTGHPGGLTTMHADSAESALLRLEHLIEEAGYPVQPQVIGAAVHYIISVARSERGRQIDKILAVQGYNKQAARYEFEEIKGHLCDSECQ